MIRELYENAKRGIDTRQNLSRLRQEIKDDRKMNDLFELVEEDMESMCAFLKSDDAKTRKNAALLMGELDMGDFAKPLVEAYKAEEQLFVRPAYLEALRSYDIKEYLAFFKGRVEELQGIPVTEENKKHTGEELKALTELIIGVEGITRHAFRGWKVEKEPLECILLTNRLHRNLTERRLEAEGVELVPFKGGVRFKAKNIRCLKDIRTYSDILFVIPGFKSCEFEPAAAAKAIWESGIIGFLEDTHTGKTPFYFRVELKSTLDLEKKSRFAKRFASELEYLTGRRLVNSASDYEVELRLIESKDGRINALVKLYTMEDDRFSYFKKHVAASIKPVNAATVVELAKEYMAEDAQVLDPFCGVGTMLIERQKAVKANTSYGLDINSEAVEGAVCNTEAAGQIVHYINRDFFTFRHEYLFDEIFTDMPFSMGSRGLPEIENIYRRFFLKAGEVLKEKGRIILFSRNPEYGEKYGKKAGYCLMKRFAMSEKDDTAVMIFEKKTQP